tara:strand:- start:1261 stop:1479 length:219 start_codon:yes stop_codon:yes gene_type:complete
MDELIIRKIGKEQYELVDNEDVRKYRGFPKLVNAMILRDAHKRYGSTSLRGNFSQDEKTAIMGLVGLLIDTS